jgi:4-hydroxyproline epimerase
MPQVIRILDTHTAGEPTRVVISGGPDLGDGPLAERRSRFRGDFDRYRSAIVNEPRGSDVLVGALLTPPTDPACCAGVIFFNNVGYLGMCGHGTIGVAVALGHLGRISAGVHRLETPVGIVSFAYDGQHRVSLENVPSYRHREGVALEIEGYDTVRGDIAWGGNWFFLMTRLEADGTRRSCPALAPSHVSELTEITQAIRTGLVAQGITGAKGAEIDHIELFAPPGDSQNHSRNFVLCPGGAYDRSPCGTGTSAKLACLAADGKLAPDEIWRQESILGSVFEASYRWAEDHSAILPTITGTAYVIGEAMLNIDPGDPFAWGIPRQDANSV